MDEEETTQLSPISPEPRRDSLSTATETESHSASKWAWLPFRSNGVQLDTAQRRRRRIIMLLVTLAVLIVLVVPSVFAILTGLQDYSSLKSLGLSGVHHLLAAKDDLTTTSTSSTSGASSSSNSCSIASTPTATAAVTATAKSSASGNSVSGGSSSTTSSIPDASQIRSAQNELQEAQTDFKALRVRMAQPDWVLGAAGRIPGIHTELDTVTALANTGYDVSTMGIEMLSAAGPVIDRLHGHSLGNQTLLTQSDINNLQHATDNSLTLLSDVQVQLKQININDLPICAAEKTEFSKLAGELPRAQNLLGQASTLIQPIGWMLGVDGPRHFLLQTLDDTELRSTGGFAGEFGIATIQNGKLAPLTLYNVDLIDYRAPQFGGFTNNWNINRRPPALYSWWPIANWGLRDSNLNADFPTDAKLVMGVFKDEGTDPALESQGSQNLDGLINITPEAIANVLTVTGPLYVPGYNVNVTGANLESEIHYYQLDPAGLAKNLQVFPQDGTEANARKRFAQTVAHLLEQRVETLPLSELQAVAKQAFTDLQSHAISVYVTNPTLENLLVSHQAAGAISTTPGVDGLAVVHTNWSAGKINAHIKVNQTDNVTLDNKGGATHNLTISINDYYISNTYGDFVTYWDFVRVYVPPAAKLISADGFNSKSNVLCVMPRCPADPYPGGQLVCPDGNYNPGPRTNTLLGQDGDPPLYVDGGPTDTTSDVTGRAMWAGNVMVPMGCTATITLSWYVPNIAAPSSAVPAASAPYSYEVQRQGGTQYGLQVTLHPAPNVKAEGTKTVTYKVTSNADYTFSFGQAPQPPPAFKLP